MLLILVLVVVVLLGLFVRNRIRLQNVLQENGVPTPPVRFIDGNFFDLVQQNVTTKFAWLKQYGTIVGFYIGSRPYIVTTDTELIRNIQVKHFQLFSLRQSFGVIGGLEAKTEMEQSLVHPEIGSRRWKEQRLQTMFYLDFSFLSEDIVCAT
jgi:hypothetical protein